MCYHKILFYYISRYVVTCCCLKHDLYSSLLLLWSGQIVTDKGGCVLVVPKWHIPRIECPLKWIGMLTRLWDNDYSFFNSPQYVPTSSILPEKAKWAFLSGFIVDGYQSNAEVTVKEQNYWHHNPALSPLSEKPIFSPEWLYL